VTGVQTCALPICTTWNSSCRSVRASWCWPRAASSRRASRKPCGAMPKSSRPTLATDILALEEVVAGYGKMTVLQGLSCTIARGAITTVIGPNGAGKSTMFKTVFGMLPARSGRILFEGAEITNLQPRDLLVRGISYVPQGRNIFPELSVRHNLELGTVMAPVGFDLAGRMEAAMARFPVLRRKADQQASTLSGGEQKML